MAQQAKVQVYRVETFVKRCSREPLVLDWYAIPHHPIKAKSSFHYLGQSALKIALMQAPLTRCLPWVVLKNLSFLLKVLQMCIHTPTYSPTFAK